jgi:hypothetical protein
VETAVTTGHLSQFTIHSRRTWALRTLGGPPPQRSDGKTKQSSPEEERAREYAESKVSHMKLDDDVPIGRRDP